jgi:tRNA threonylcarbamoyladenosine biosynthesis protein TsaB
MKLLALDTATELCSAALWIDGQLSIREELRPRGHGELILPMIDELLRERGASLSQLDAIAFGRGPGAFTGVRLAVSVAQGLGFSAGLPLIAVSDLRALAAQVMLQQPADGVLVCQDARMGEVYWGCYERSAESLCTLVGSEAVAPPAAVALPADWKGKPMQLRGAGSGFAAYEAGLSASAGALCGIHPLMRPRAQEIAQLAARDGKEAAVAPEEAQPVYLRDEVVSLPNQRVTFQRS